MTKWLPVHGAQIPVECADPLKLFVHEMSRSSQPSPVGASTTHSAMMVIIEREIISFISPRSKFDTLPRVVIKY